MKSKKSFEYFHSTPEDYNCAQSILKGFQVEFNISDSQINSFRAFGGGRAEKGICGALYSADMLLKKNNLSSVSEEFAKKCGGLTCKEIKGRKCSCTEYVKIADELVRKRISEQIL